MTGNFFASNTGSCLCGLHRLELHLSLVYLQVGGLGSMLGGRPWSHISDRGAGIFGHRRYKPMTFGVLLIVVMLLVPTSGQNPK
jgi:hypothetical protein